MHYLCVCILNFCYRGPQRCKYKVLHRILAQKRVVCAEKWLIVGYFHFLSVLLYKRAFNFESWHWLCYDACFQCMNYLLSTTLGAPYHFLGGRWIDKRISNRIHTYTSVHCTSIQWGCIVECNFPIHELRRPGKTLFRTYPKCWLDLLNKLLIIFVIFLDALLAHSTVPVDI